MVDPKALFSRPTFLSGLEAQDLLAPVWRPCQFSAKNMIFKSIATMIYYHQSKENCLPSE